MGAARGAGPARERDTASGGHREVAWLCGQQVLKQGPGAEHSKGPPPAAPQQLPAHRHSPSQPQPSALSR